MDARTAESHFKEADSLYRDGRYDEALDRLIELDEAFPNTPNILFPLARCLRHVGRVDESLAICDDLITRCGDLRALELREFIRKSHDPQNEPTPEPQIHSIEGLNQDAHAGVLDDLLGPQTNLPPALPQPDQPKPYKKYALIGGVVLLALIVLALPIVLRLINGPPPSAPPPDVSVAMQAPESSGIQPDAGNQTPPAEMTEAQLQAQVAAAERLLIPLLIMIIVLILVSNTASLYLTLLITGKLPYETVGDNLINTGFMAVAIALMNIVPCLGFIGSLYVLYKTYDFGFLDFLIWIGMNVAVGFVLGIVAQIILFAIGVPLS